MKKLLFLAGAAVVAVATSTVPASAATSFPPDGPGGFAIQPTVPPAAVKNCASLALKNPARVHSPGLVVNVATGKTLGTLPTASLVYNCMQAAAKATSAERAVTITWAYAKLGQKLSGTTGVVGVPTRATLVGAAFLASGNPMYTTASKPSVQASAPARTVLNDEKVVAQITQRYGQRTKFPAQVSPALPVTKPGDVAEVYTTVTRCAPTGNPGIALCKPYVASASAAAAGLMAGQDFVITVHNNTVTLAPVSSFFKLGAVSQTLRTYNMREVMTS